jgi:hypothetical protein
MKSPITPPIAMPKAIPIRELPLPELVEEAARKAVVAGTRKEGMGAVGLVRLSIGLGGVGFRRLRFS